MRGRSGSHREKITRRDQDDLEIKRSRPMRLQRPRHKAARAGVLQLWRKDGSWNNRHGSAGFACRVPTDSVKQLKKFSYPSRKAAKEAA
jgi:hypothetical protein